MFVGKQLLRGLEDLKKQYQAIYDTAFDKNLTDQERLAKIQQMLLEAARPTNGDTLMERAKAEAIKRQAESERKANEVVILTSKES